ncbi:MAG: bifunctional phosphoribosylaminoimidazolecarboxamide formyltransferase/IMP cyclohydrolase, partial [Planctomycetes bacterium]|nr:bifunctional phosphoribosylaminoimidazolecarboxamide formyltransferase/IMP cyclohydrolase [Planctomycetota bacterium]
MDVKIGRALVSAWRKEGIAEFGSFLAGRDVEVLSTGGTAKCLRDAGVEVRDVA